MQQEGIYHMYGTFVFKVDVLGAPLKQGEKSVPQKRCVCVGGGQLYYAPFCLMQNSLELSPMTCFKLGTLVLSQQSARMWVGGLDYASSPSSKPQNLLLSFPLTSLQDTVPNTL